VADDDRLLRRRFFFQLKAARNATNASRGPICSLDIVQRFTTHLSLLPPLDEGKGNLLWWTQVSTRAVLVETAPRGRFDARWKILVVVSRLPHLIDLLAAELTLRSLHSSLCRGGSSVPLPSCRTRVVVVFGFPVKFLPPDSDLVRILLRILPPFHILDKPVDLSSPSNDGGGFRGVLFLLRPIIFSQRLSSRTQLPLHPTIPTSSLPLVSGRDLPQFLPFLSSPRPSLTLLRPLPSRPNLPPSVAQSRLTRCLRPSSRSWIR